MENNIKIYYTIIKNPQGKYKNIKPEILNVDSKEWLRKNYISTYTLYGLNMYFSLINQYYSIGEKPKNYITYVLNKFIIDFDKNLVIFIKTIKIKYYYKKQINFYKRL